LYDTVDGQRNQQLPNKSPHNGQTRSTNKAGYGGTKCPFECPWYRGRVEYGRGQCPVAEKACEEVFWLASVHPLLSQEDLDDIATAVTKVVTAFIDKKRRNVPINYATQEHRALL
jgi:hypothetical protein